MWFKTWIFCLGFSSLAALDPSEALAALMEGNERYMQDQLLHPDRTSDRREEVAEKQSPFAIIVGCSDSRVPPEIIFDQGIGDLFIVRVAGNTVGPLELDSIDFSAKYLGSSLIFVLGHEACGAVAAVLQGTTKDIEQIAKLIKPAIKSSSDLEEAVKANVRWVVDYLKKTTVIQPLMTQGKIDVRGAYYHLGSGRVEILD